MREIKFRGIKKRDGGWMYGSLVKEVCGDVWIFPEGDTYCNAGGDFYSENEPGIRMVKPDTVGQYTGLKDKNGKEIYEGDIVKARYVDEYINFRVEYTNQENRFACFRLVYSDGVPERICDPDDMEVIGNIHDNPELLKKEE